MIMDAGINAIVELADNEPMANLPRELIRLRFPVSDGGDNPDWLVQLGIESIAQLLRNQVAVLVSCSAGMSRSPCFAAAGIAVACGQPLNVTILEVMSTGPADLSPRLFGQVDAICRRIQAQQPSVASRVV